MKQSVGATRPNQNMEAAPVQEPRPDGMPDAPPSAMPGSPDRRPHSKPKQSNDRNVEKLNTHQPVPSNQPGHGFGQAGVPQTCSSHHDTPIDELLDGLGANLVLLGDGLDDGRIQVGRVERVVPHP